MFQICACSYGHPLVGVFPEADSAEDQSLLGLLGLGAAAAALADSSSSTTVLRYGYAANDGGDTISMHSVDDATGVFTALTPATVAAGGGTPRAMIKHPTASFLYTANQTTDNISMFAIASDGQLSALTPATLATGGADPTEMAMSPDGLFGFIGYNTTSQIDTYSVDAATGQWSFLSSLSGCTVARELVFHPNGQYFYALCSSGNQIRRHSYSSGVITHLGNTTGPGSQANGLAITPDGLNLYATSQSSTALRMYSIDGSTGHLTTQTPPSKATDNWPAEVAIDAAGRYVFVNCWNAGALSVRQYVIGSDGVLTDNTPTSIPTGGSQPIGMRVDPTGRYVYVGNGASDTINMYSIDSDTGLLTSNGLLGTGNGVRAFAFVTETVVE